MEMINSIEMGETFYIAIPSTNPIYDGIIVYETIAKEINNVSLNGYPLKYCFKNKEDADAFSKQENKKGYQAYIDYFNHRVEIGLSMYGNA